MKASPRWGGRDLRQLLVGALLGAAVALPLAAALRKLLAVEPGVASAPAATDGTTPARDREPTSVHAEPALAPREDAGQPEGERDELREEPTEDATLISAALERFALAGIAQGWKDVRPEPIPDPELAQGYLQFEDGVRQSPRLIGAELARARTKLEEALADARTGGGFTLLEKLVNDDVGPMIDFVRSDALDGLFVREAGDSVVDGLTHREHPDAHLADGATLSFPAGVFRIEHLMSEVETFPRDVTIAGAGMNVTLLLFGDLSTREKLRNFTIRDCTVFTQNDELFDLRVEAALASCERVRFVGFDCGAGSSNLISARSHPIALRATDCRIEGGFGRSPQHGQLFDIRTASLVRLRRCHISLVRSGVSYVASSATVVFESCALVDMLDDPESSAGTRPGVAFPGTTIHRFEGDPLAVPKRDLNELFPDWETRLNR